MDFSEIVQMVGHVERIDEQRRARTVLIVKDSERNISCRQEI